MHVHVRACVCVRVHARGVCERVKLLKTLTENKFEILKLQLPKYFFGGEPSR